VSRQLLYSFSVKSRSDRNPLRVFRSCSIGKYGTFASKFGLRLARSRSAVRSRPNSRLIKVLLTLRLSLVGVPPGPLWGVTDRRLRPLPWAARQVSPADRQREETILQNASKNRKPARLISRLNFGQYRSEIVPLSERICASVSAASAWARSRCPEKQKPLRISTCVPFAN